MLCQVRAHGPPPPQFQYTYDVVATHAVQLEHAGFTLPGCGRLSMQHCCTAKLMHRCMFTTPCHALYLTTCITYDSVSNHSSPLPVVTQYYPVYVSFAFYNNYREGARFVRSLLVRKSHSRIL